MAGTGGGKPGEGVAAFAFGARAAGGDLPSLPAQQLEGGVDAQRRGRVQGDPKRARHAQHVADAVTFAVLAQLTVAAVDGIGGAPADVDTGIDVLGEDFPGRVRVWS
jgi:hypothetical protein